MLNVIAQLQQLLLTGLTREVELFARLRPGDPWIVGKLDEVALAMERPGGSGGGEDADGGRQYAQMVEIKTRSQPNKPRDGQARNACLQVRVDGGGGDRGSGQWGEGRFGQARNTCLQVCGGGRGETGREFPGPMF